MSAGCEGKVRFDSMALAQVVAKRGNRRRDETNQAYRCRDCHGYHVGGINRRRLPAELRRRRLKEIEV